MQTYTEEVALLVAQSGPLNGQRWALRGSLLLGRDPTCEITIADRQVSRNHARFTVTPEGVLVEDLGSKNGTYHNGALIAGNILLQDGDIVQIALAQKLVFLSSDATVPLEEHDLGLKALQQTEPPTQKTVLCVLSLDKRSRRVWVMIEEGTKYHQTEILPPLSLAQFRLLELLLENAGEVVSRAECVAAVWGKEQALEVSEQALDALVRRLRDRIASVDPSHTYIVTVRGHGLRMDNPEIDDLLISQS